MARIHFGHCIGCDQPIRPPYLSFTAHHCHGDGNQITSWEEADVCAPCAAKLTADDLYRLVNEDDAEPSKEVRMEVDLG